MRRFTMFFCAATVFAGILTAAPEDKRAQPAEKKAETAKPVKDPVCGMTVDPKTAEKASYQGKAYYFCSREEKAEFEKNPSKYIKK